MSGPTNYVILENGVWVEAAEDLLPLVDDSSVTATAAPEAQQAETWMWGSVITMSSLAALGLAATTVPSAIMGISGQDNRATVQVLGMGLLGGTLLTAGALAVLPVFLYQTTKFNKERDTAFLTLDEP